MNPFRRASGSRRITLFLRPLLVAGMLASANAATDRARAMEHVVVGLCDDRTGVRVCRLEIDRVGTEFDRRGFLRVAWRPMLRLDGVSLTIEAGATWPTVGEQIVRGLNLGELGGKMTGMPVLRKVRLELPAPREVFVAAEGRLRPDGALELTTVTLAVGAEEPHPLGNIVFWLTGPRAGKWTPLTSPRERASILSAALNSSDR